MDSIWVGLMLGVEERACWVMCDFYRILERVEKGQRQMALATIIDIKGTSYRKAGTSMLLVSEEPNIGMISGGCLENDLKARVDQWFSLNSKDFEQLRSETLVYDMRSDNENEWGRSSGCNGIITVLLEPVAGTFRNQLLHMKKQMDRGLSAVILRKMERDSYIKRAVVFEDGQVFGDRYDFQGLIQSTPFCELAEKRDPNLFGVIRRVRPRLIIFGAGDDAIPLTELAAKTGWMVNVRDFRAAFCHVERFPAAETCQVGMPKDLLSGITPRDSVVIMTHDFQVDRLLLHGLIERDVTYLGILGPRARTKRLLKETPWPHQLHAPVGIPIEAEGPEEIAVSIMAEVIKAYRQSLKKVSVAHG